MKKLKTLTKTAALVVTALACAVSLMVIAGCDTGEPTPETPPPAADAPPAPPVHADPPPGVAVEPPPPLDLPDIPGSGGEMPVDGDTVFHFIPDKSGNWIFTTSDNDGDPMLAIYNQYGVTIAEDDDSAGEQNSRISIELEAGHQYTVHATFSGDTTEGSYTLTVEQG